MDVLHVVYKVISAPHRAFTTKQIKLRDNVALKHTETELYSVLTMRQAQY